MEDHVHILLEGVTPSSQFTSTMTLVRQVTAMTFRRLTGCRLWQEGYYERVLRAKDDAGPIIAYIRRNPEAAGLGPERRRSPFVGP
jgi:REP element-mobilizing transposase RayT